MAMKIISKKYMQLAIAQARKNIAVMQGGPFGACVVKKNKVIATAHNKVLVSDATAHAEINAIRKASKKLKTHDLSGCIIYSTTEPCPMCFTACNWAKFDAVIYGNNIRDARKIGFNEFNISSYRMKKLGKAKMRLIGGIMRKECNRLLKDWNKLKNKKLY
jgi:tRNA(Arg) A34 adenosine deaminase TadA